MFSIKHLIIWHIFETLGKKVVFFSFFEISPGCSEIAIKIGWFFKNPGMEIIVGHRTCPICKQLNVDVACLQEVIMSNRKLIHLLHIIRFYLTKNMNVLGKMLCYRTCVRRKVMKELFIFIKLDIYFFKSTKGVSKLQRHEDVWLCIYFMVSLQLQNKVLRHNITT